VQEVLNCGAAMNSLNLADAVLVASAPADGRISSSDGPLLSVAASEGIATVVLPDSRGRRASG
jgi:hypothetical protein